jgi:hypothetical protein
MSSGITDCTQVTQIVVDPFNASTVYAGCGSFSTFGGGIHKTTNGATSWTPINNGVPNFSVTGMVADRTNAPRFTQRQPAAV